MPDIDLSKLEAAAAALSGGTPAPSAPKKLRRAAQPFAQSFQGMYPPPMSVADQPQQAQPQGAVAPAVDPVSTGYRPTLQAEDASAALIPATSSAILAHLKAQAIRETMDKAQIGSQATGKVGPGGVRVGEGPNGYMISIGDAVGQLFKAQQRKEAEGKESETSQNAAWLDQLANWFKARDISAASGKPVPQGTPMTRPMPQDQGGTGTLSF